MRISDWSSDVCSSDLTGQTPTAFITERRLEQSARLIANAEAATITEIALDVGFNDPGFFSRCFRRRFGLSPTEWRSEKHTSELQSLMRISYAVFCLKKKKTSK